MFSAWKSRRRKRRPVVLPDAARPRQSAIALELPNPYGGQPWLSATVALSRTARGQGGTLRLRAHFDSRLRLTPQHGAPALSTHRDDAATLLTRGQQQAARLVRGVLERLPAERLAPLTQRRWRSWVDVQVSSAPLDQGADALVPERLRALWGAGLPRAESGAPRVGVWAGPAGGPLGGKASLVWLQVDATDLPGTSMRAGDSSFNLNASVAQLVEPQSGAD